MKCAASSPQRAGRAINRIFSRQDHFRNRLDGSVRSSLMVHSSYLPLAA
jgi:hypothetical protein